MTASAEPAPDAPYVSLYRRYRPQRFTEVRGQEHVALALRHAVRDGRVAHAYLFSGPRGTGKTSTARILAKALDCASPSDGEPCGVCDSCHAIATGSSFDVHELDAASNNGVDAMRDLVARSTLSTPGRWKVYIVDEVHMLSTQASNALLKTLEEPPEHVVFVLATTDPQKVLPTIRSRTQHFEFHLLNEQTIDELLADVTRDAGIDLPDGAIETVARRARGSARDALSVLDQVAASGVIEDSADVLTAIVTAVAERDPHELLASIDRAVEAGHDPQQLAVDLVERLRAGFLLQFGQHASAPLTPAERDAVDGLGTARCVRTMEVAGGAIVAMRDAPEPRVTLEVALLRCTHPEADTSPEAIIERLERLERLVVSRPEHADAGRDPHRASTDAARSDAARPDSTRPDAGPQRPARAAPERAAPPPQPAAGREGPGSAPAVQSEAAGPEPVRTATEEAAPVQGSSSSRRPTIGALRGTARPAREEASTTDEPGPQAAPHAAAASAPAAPTLSLEAVVGAWSSALLAELRPKARAIYQAARFEAVDGAVVTAGLPNAAHVQHAEPLRADVERALGAHFGATLSLRLVVAKEEPRAALVEPATADLEPGDPDEGGESGGAATSTTAWAEDQLRAAFPGAEEI